MIDPDGVVQYIVVTNANVGRSVYALYFTSLADRRFLSDGMETRRPCNESISDSEDPSVKKWPI